ncbi:MAG: hypothetical protein EOM37_16695 [Proteobacteria bacterium]|nr:hypothetical protein [Pseudomonadota bacterium]
MKELLRTVSRSANVGGRVGLSDFGAVKGERIEGRLDCCSGYYGWTPEADQHRFGKLELRAPQDHQRQFSTMIFERNQLSVRILLSALAEMYIQGVVYTEGQADQRGVSQQAVKGTQIFEDAFTPKKPSSSSWQSSTTLAPLSGRHHCGSSIR